MTSPSPAWTARTGTPPAPALVEHGASTDADALLVDVDLIGSIAHTIALHDASLVTTSEATTLIEGLQEIAQAFTKGAIALDSQLEDVHMNVEHLLEQEAGAVAKKLHTGRSRNDQVALDLVLFQQDALVHIANATHALASALASKAHEHAKTPWPLHTHGLPGQPATLGYLLHAHALRFAKDTKRTLATLEATKSSPLGAGAGAGSTLPIDPAVSAHVLGLDPFENGLLATGTRDASLQATHQAATIGHHVQDLAADVIGLSQAGALELPSAFTTGSSIMPHKKNPDALELARADGATLAALHQQALTLTAGLGLGYHRDLQRAKPPTLQALTLAPDLLTMLADLLEGLEANASVLEAMQGIPGVASTDAVEALVKDGLPFREAHRVVSEACHEAEKEASFEEALEDALEQEAQGAALEALQADPNRRATPGGPAPDQVHVALEALEEALTVLDEALSEASQAVDARASLLEVPPGSLLDAGPKAVAP